MLTELDKKKMKSNGSGTKRKRVDGYIIDSVEDNGDVNHDNDENDMKLPGRDIDNINNDNAATGMEELRMTTKKSKIGFAAMAQAIAAKWKVIDEQTLAHYREIASQDMKRYRQEMEEYKQDGGGVGGRNDDNDEDDD
jgi:hypothetical protein